LFAGTQPTLLIRIVNTWGLAATVLVLAPTLVPPGFAAAAPAAATPSMPSSAAASVAARNLNGLMAPELATNIPSRRLGSVPESGVRG
jgi:hypothetical protein